ncbi:MAG: cytochrome B [Blastochloris sp.]|nr:cytochrome B [Blastochloris sp.]
MKEERPTKKCEVMIYSRYERFWHWSQALLIFTLFFTGLRIHETHDLISFPLAVTLHTNAAYTLIALWIFTTFWNFTTGQWRQYMFKPGIMKVVRFYAYGILVGEPHPYKKSLQRKQNALQSLAYMTFMVIIGPALWLTGIALLFYPSWNSFEWSNVAMKTTALLHTGSAYAMGVFVIIHIYMTTTGKTPLHYVKTMFTGYDKIELSEVEEAYLAETKMVDIKGCSS